MDDIQVGDQFEYQKRLFTVKMFLGADSVRLTEVVPHRGVITHQVSRQFLRSVMKPVDTGCLPYSHRS